VKPTSDELSKYTMLHYDVRGFIGGKALNDIKTICMFVCFFTVFKIRNNIISKTTAVDVVIGDKVLSNVGTFTVSNGTISIDKQVYYHYIHTILI
jgi:hypothetical protein